MMMGKALGKQLREYFSHINCTKSANCDILSVFFFNSPVHAAFFEGQRHLWNQSHCICTAQHSQSIQGKHFSANPHCRKRSQEMLMAPLQCWKNPTAEKAGGKKRNYREGSGFKREERGEKNIQNLSYLNQIISEVTKRGFGDNNLGQISSLRK